MHDIFNLADNDLILCDFDTRLNDYTKNLNFSNELDVIGCDFKGTNSFQDVQIKLILLVTK